MWSRLRGDFGRHVIQNASARLVTPRRKVSQRASVQAASSHARMHLRYPGREGVKLGTVEATPPDERAVGCSVSGQAVSVTGVHFGQWWVRGATSN